MEIKISTGKRDITIRGADGCFEFCELRNIKNSEKVVVPTLVPYAWFNSIEAALSRLVELKISNCKATTLEELQMEIRKIRKEITDIYGTGI